MQKFVNIETKVVSICRNFVIEAPNYRNIFLYLETKIVANWLVNNSLAMKNRKRMH